MTDPENQPRKKAATVPVRSRGGMYHNEFSPENDPWNPWRGKPRRARDRMLRTLAGMENLRKRTEREVADARIYGISGFARDISISPTICIARSTPFRPRPMPLPIPG